MSFSVNLKKAMTDLNLNQAQVVGLTGIGKSSISQYLSGKNEPTELRQRDMAVALGLPEDYFIQDIEPVIRVLKRKDSVIPQIHADVAAKLMRKNPQNVRRGLQQGIFPWGYAIRTSGPNAEKETYTYFINAVSFAEIERIEVPQEMVF